MEIDIRSLSLQIEPSQDAFIRERLLYALSRFGHRIRRVMVRLEDLNGPRGGLDKRCHLEAQLHGRGVMVVDVSDFEFEPAVHRAAARMARRVSEEMRRRRDARRRSGSGE